MKKLLWIITGLIWLISLIILIIALTNLIPGNAFANYRLIIGLGFLAISGFIGIGLKKLQK